MPNIILVKYAHTHTKIKYGKNKVIISTVQYKVELVNKYISI